MGVVRIGTLEPQRFVRAKTAILSPATRADRAQVAGEWLDVANTPIDHPLDAVTVIGRHTFAPGDTLDIQDVTGRIIAKARVLGIRLRRADDLTDADLHALGYADRADFAAGWGALVEGARAWWFEVERLDTPTLVQ